MAETAERLVATLEADIRGFTKGMQEAQRQFDRNAAAIERRQNAMMARINKGFSGVNLGPLISRYFSVAAAIRATQAVVRESIQNNDEAAKSWERLEAAMASIGEESGPAVSAVFNVLSAIVERLSYEIGTLNKDWDALKRTFEGGVNIPMGVSPLQPGYNKTATLDKKSGNYTTQPGGFGASGVTDITPDLSEIRRKAREKAEIEKGIAQDGFDIQQHFRDQETEALEKAAEIEIGILQHYSDVKQTMLERDAAELADIHERMQQATDEADVRAAEHLQDLADLEAERIADRISEIGDAFEYLGMAAFQGGEAFERALAQMAQSLALSGLRNLLEAGLTSLAGGGGIFSGLIKGRASGGPVSGGTPYVVGERGPELFVPRSSGTIVPNAARASGGGAIVINMPVDARGAQMGVADQIDAKLRAVVPAILSAADRNNRASFKTNLIRTNSRQM